MAGATGPRVVILGDSLTAGLGLPMARAYPSLLQRHVDDAGLMYTIVNAGVSGDTSAGGLSRLDWALDGDVRILVVALGGNDGLRGLPVAELSRNLSQIIERAQARGIGRDSGGHGSAAELRSRLHLRLSQGVSGTGEKIRRDAHPISARAASRGLPT